VNNVICIECSNNPNCRKLVSSNAKKSDTEKAGKREHHLWMRRESAGSGQKALNLVRIVGL
ncbi:hypothetical protein GIB67_039924, partial [Kingdonia uniflora]